MEEREEADPAAKDEAEETVRPSAEQRRRQAMVEGVAESFAVDFALATGEPFTKVRKEFLDR